MTYVYEYIERIQETEIKKKTPFLWDVISPYPEA